MYVRAFAEIAHAVQVPHPRSAKCQRRSLPSRQCVASSVRAPTLSENASTSSGQAGEHRSEIGFHSVVERRDDRPHDMVVHGDRELTRRSGGTEHIGLERRLQPAQCDAHWSQHTLGAWYRGIPSAVHTKSLSFNAGAGAPSHGSSRVGSCPGGDLSGAVAAIAAWETISRFNS